MSKCPTVPEARLPLNKCHSKYWVSNIPRNSYCEANDSRPNYFKPLAGCSTEWLHSSKPRSHFMPSYLPNATFRYPQCSLQKNHCPTFYHLLQGFESHHIVSRSRNTRSQTGLLALHIGWSGADKTDECRN